MQLGTKVGERLLIAGQPFTIRGVIAQEPGRRIGAFSFGARVIVDMADFRQTGLLGFGSRASYQLLFKVREDGVDRLTRRLRRELRENFASARSYASLEDDIGDDLGRAENYLSLVGFVIVVLGGIGVWSVTRVFVRQKIKSVAILKCLGATTAQVLATVRSAGRSARRRRKRDRRSHRCGRHSTDPGVAFSLVRRYSLRADSFGHRAGDCRRPSGVAALRAGSAPRSSSRQALVAPSRRRSRWAADHGGGGARTPRLSPIGRLAAGDRRGRCDSRARSGRVLASGLASRRFDRFGRLCRGNSRALWRGLAARPGGAAARQREVVSPAPRRYSASGAPATRRASSSCLWASVASSSSGCERCSRTSSPSR